MSYVWIEPLGPQPPKFCGECGGPLTVTDRVERVSVAAPDGHAVACYRKLRVVRAWCPACEPGKNVYKDYAP